MRLWRTIAEGIERDGRAALVTLATVAGSSPRETGARMAIRPNGSFAGTIGGGALEWECMQAARALMDVFSGVCGRAERRSHSLGPDLGQCCGGRVTVLTEVFTVADMGWIARLAAAESQDSFSTIGRLDEAGRYIREILAEITRSETVISDFMARDDSTCMERFGPLRTSVYLFGAGHVGRALVMALAPLPFRIRWIDERAEAFPAVAPANVTSVCLADPAQELGGAPPDTQVLVMTHSHARDLEIVASSLRNPHVTFTGLIGSATKRARFLARLQKLGFSSRELQRLTCPIGIAGLQDKSPAVIAASAAAQLLMERERAALHAVTPKEARELRVRA